MTHANPIRADALEINEAEDGLVVYDTAHETVHHLNPSAAIIFDLCDGSRDVETIASVLTEAFELEAPATDAARAGLRELAERRLILWGAHSDDDD
jgi:hypothetical protein